MIRFAEFGVSEGRRALALRLLGRFASTGSTGAWNLQLRQLGEFQGKVKEWEEKREEPPLAALAQECGRKQTC